MPAVTMAQTAKASTGSGERSTRLFERLLTTRTDDELAAFSRELLGNGAPQSPACCRNQSDPAL